jgi:hypothetical protein
MDNLIYLFAVAVLLASALAAIGIWAPRKLWLKASALIVTALLSVTAYASYADLLGKPKPVSLEWAARHAPEATVLAASLRENEAIFVWLEFEGASDPRAYALPWSQQAADQLQQAMREAEENGTGVQMQAPFETDRQPTEPVFYAAPQPALPPKQASGDGPLVYSQPDNQL